MMASAPESRSCTTKRLDLTALSIQDAVRILGISGERIQADIEMGLPTNPDGTINLVQYAAWLNRLLNQKDASDAQV